MFNFFKKEPKILNNEITQTKELIKSSTFELLQHSNNNLISKMKLLGEIMPIINKIENLNYKKVNPLIKELKDLLENYYIGRR